jgi:hypothetical protein
MFFVMYGNSYVNTMFQPIPEAFQRFGMPALMTVFRNENRWDASIVEFAEGVVLIYDKSHLR